MTTLSRRSRLHLPGQLLRVYRVECRESTALYSKGFRQHADRMLGVAKERLIGELQRRYGKPRVQRRLRRIMAILNRMQRQAGRRRA